MLGKIIIEHQSHITIGNIKGDQASIIGGVVEFIKELHQVLQSLESQKRRKSLSPSPGSGPSPKQLQPSPRQLANANIITNHSFQFDGGKELVASCNSPVADVEAKISGSNVVLRVISKKIRGQLLRIISVLEKLSFDIIHLNISSMDDTFLYYFVVKVFILSLSVLFYHSFGHNILCFSPSL